MIKLNVGHIEKETLDLSGGFLIIFPNQLLTNKIIATYFRNDVKTNLNVGMEKNISYFGQEYPTQQSKWETEDLETEPKQILTKKYPKKQSQWAWEPSKPKGSYPRKYLDYVDK